MSDNITINPSTGVSEATTLAADDAGAAGKVQIVKLAISTDGVATVLPADTANGLDVDVTRLPGNIASDIASTATAVAHGTYAYAAGTTATTVAVPAGGRVRRVTVAAGGTAATLTIAGGDTITVLAGNAFDENIPGDATLGGDVVVGGGVAAYYVAWTTA